MLSDRPFDYGAYINRVDEVLFEHLIEILTQIELNYF